MQDISEFTATLTNQTGLVKPAKNFVRCLIYGPEGQLSCYESGPGRMGSRGKTGGVVYWDEVANRPVIQPELQEMQKDGFPAWGWYQDLCRATGETQYFEKYKAYTDMVAKDKEAGRPRFLTPQVPGPKTDKDPDGKRTAFRPTPDDWLHPVLVARREGHKNGRVIRDWGEITTHVSDDGKNVTFTVGGVPQTPEASGVLGEFAKVGQDGE